MHVILRWMIYIAFIGYRMSAGNFLAQENDRPSEKSHLWIRCYDDLGCVNNTEEWYHRLLRPVTEQPLPRHIIKTTFVLFNEGNDPIGRVAEVENFVPRTRQIAATNFDPKKPRTHILIHDFTSNGMAGWIKHTAKSLLAIGAGNVISVDWTGGAEPPYPIAIQNARLVALEIALLIRILSKDFGTSPERFYLIGQGLGAHVAGYVGQKINGVGRITGLDPVGLYFKGMPSTTRLDPTDAKFVDVINTDVETNGGQGSGDLYGYLNFFPNGGLTQPGCNLTSLYPSFEKINRQTLKQGEVAPGCNHKRAAKYFTDSIDERDRCTFTAYACKDYVSFKRAECTKGCNEDSPCLLMGHLADIDFIRSGFNYAMIKSTGLFLDTNYEHPYCMFAYRILIALVKDRSMNTSRQNGRMTVISGSFFANISSEIEATSFGVTMNTGPSKRRIKMRGNNIFLAYKNPPKLNKPTKVSLRFKSDDNEDDTTIRVKYLEIGVLPMDKGESSAPQTRFCGKKEDITTTMRSGDEGAAEFERCIDKPRPRVKKSLGFIGPSILRLHQRNPKEKDQSRISEEALDVSADLYDEGEPPEPAEDDYYSNR